MQQNYKIFIGENIIDITSSKPDPVPEDSVIIEYEQQAEHLNTSLNQFLNFDKTSRKLNLPEKIKHLVLVSKNTESLWNQITQDFQIVEAGGGIVQNTEGNYLLIYRHQTWDLPKGKIEPGESIREAAIREVEEETAAKIIDCDQHPFDITHHVYFDHDKGFIKKSYWFLMKSSGPEQLIPQTDEQITEAIWADKQRMLSKKDQAYPSIKYLFDSIIKSSI